MGVGPVPSDPLRQWVQSSENRIFSLNSMHYGKQESAAKNTGTVMAGSLDQAAAQKATSGILLGHRQQAGSYDWLSMCRSELARDEPNKSIRSFPGSARPVYGCPVQYGQSEWRNTPDGSSSSARCPAKSGFHPAQSEYPGPLL